MPLNLKMMDKKRKVMSIFGKRVVSICSCQLTIIMAMPPPQAPDSPRASQSPPPAGIQGDLELELLDLANALYNLGTTVINDSTKERDRPGQPNVKPVGAKVYVKI